jgi:hypothetical protein
MARPTTSQTSEGLSAATIEPATSMARQISSIRRLPNMSARRPTVGMDTAPASRVAVMAQEVSAAEALSRCGSCGSRGMTKVCCRETVMPASARTVMSSRGERAAFAGCTGFTSVTRVSS